MAELGQHLRLDDDETRISGAQRADVNGMGAWKSLKSGNFTRAKNGDTKRGRAPTPLPS